MLPKHTSAQILKSRVELIKIKKQRQEDEKHIVINGQELKETKR